MSKRNANQSTRRHMADKAMRALYQKVTGETSMHRYNIGGYEAFLANAVKNGIEVALIELEADTAKDE